MAIGRWAPLGTGEVYSLYVVGAELGVLNLFPAVGQLWGAEQTAKRQMQINSSAAETLHGQLDTRNEAWCFDWQLHSMLTYTQRTRGLLLFCHCVFRA